MQSAPGNSELLELWERGRTQSVVGRALLLAGVSRPGVAPGALAQLSIGQRDACLLELHESLFGPQVSALAECPSCRERLELNFGVNDVRVNPENPAPGVCAVLFKEFEVSFRVPDSTDLQALIQRGNASDSRRFLVQRCILEVRRRSEPVSDYSLTEELADAISEKMSELDPQANVMLSLNCPNCAVKWQSPFDIVSFIWGDLNAWALRLLREVHVLASAYGWKESEILALSQFRRQAYLELAAQ